jgi:hypothetical protein
MYLYVMDKKHWVSPTLISMNTSHTIKSGVVCLGYEAVGGTSVAFYTSGTGLLTVNDGCTPFPATASCNGAMIRSANGNTCAPVAMVCS